MHLRYCRNIAKSISSVRRQSIPNSLGEKFDWLAANFPFIDWRQIVLCGDKSIIRAEYMIDDNIHHLRRFEGEKILFDSPHNRKVPDAVHRVHNWDEGAVPFPCSGRVALQLELIQESDSPRPRSRSSTWAGVLESTPAHVDDLSRRLGESDS